MSANIKASTDGTQAIIGVGGVDQMTVSNAGVVTANSFVGNVTGNITGNVTGGGTFSGNASSATALATGSTTARTLANRFADVVNVKDFGAVGDGVADDTAAMLAAEAAGESVYFPEGNYKVTVVPKLGVSWGIGKVFISGIQTYLHPTTGPVNEVFVSVFGPNNTATADAYAELQRAIDFAQSVDLPLTLEQNAKYAIGTGLTFKHGKSLSDPKRYNAHINGNNCTFYPTSIINTIHVIPQGVGTGAISSIIIKDITFNGFSAPTAKALVIGSAGIGCDNFSFSRLDNILIDSFNSNAALFFIECRHIACKNIVIRGSTCRFQANSTGSFCGDMVFHACEFVDSSTQNPIVISSGGPASIRGIHFDNCYIYGGQTEIISNGGSGSQAGDIWFVACQFDQGPNKRALYIASQNNGQVFQIHIISCYIVSYGNASNNCITITGGGNLLDDIQISDCAFGGIVGTVLSAFLAKGLIVSNNIFNTTQSATQCIDINNCQNLSIVNNIAYNSVSVSYGISIHSSSTKYSIIGNTINASISAVNDYVSGTPTRQVLNNLLT